jgi:hypothetical protein
VPKILRVGWKNKFKKMSEQEIEDYVKKSINDILQKGFHNQYSTFK